eukprot:6267719-Prymnesium_polylepis.1
MAGAGRALPATHRAHILQQSCGHPLPPPGLRTFCCCLMHSEDTPNEGGEHEQPSGHPEAAHQVGAAADR